ncbi:MAG: hypothetical protein MUE46_09925 [Xanthomonadales bacterium]|nr:hypothetical protein [Xanthomonadales bacterium]
MFDRTDTHHAAAIRFLRELRKPLISNLMVLTEACWALDFSFEAQRDCLSWVQQAVRIDADSAQDLPRITEILRKYRDLPADFADASLVALCDRLSCYDIASVDQDFTIYRGAGKRVFRNMFPLG